MYECDIRKSRVESLISLLFFVQVNMPNKPKRIAKDKDKVNTPKPQRIGKPQLIAKGRVNDEFEIAKNFKGNWRNAIGRMVLDSSSPPASPPRRRRGSPERFPPGSGAPDLTRVKRPDFRTVDIDSSVFPWNWSPSWLNSSRSWMDNVAMLNTSWFTDTMSFEGFCLTGSIFHWLYLAQASFLAAALHW